MRHTNREAGGESAVESRGSTLRTTTQAVSGRRSTSRASNDDEPLRVPRSWVRSSLVFLGFLALAILWLLPAWRDPVVRWPGNTGDPEGAMWLLGWTPYAISHALNPLFTRQMGYPVGVNLAWNPLSPLLGVVSWPALVVGGPILQYNAALTLGLAANGWAGYVAVCHWVTRRRFGILGGLLFGMSPYVIGQAMAHPMLATAPGVPLMAVALDEAWRLRRCTVVRSGLALGASGLLVLLISEEMFASMLVMIGVAACWAGWRSRHTWRSWWSRAMGTGAVGVVITAPVLGAILWTMVLGSARVTGQTVPLSQFSADLSSFIVPGATSALAIPSIAVKVANFSGNAVEAGLYIGLPFLLLLAWAWRRRVAQPWLGGVSLVMVAAAVLAMGPTLKVWGRPTGIPLPGRLLDSIPLMHELVPDRFGLYLGLGVALLVPIILEHAIPLGTSGRWARYLVIFGVASWIPLSVFTSSVAIPAIFSHPVIPARAVVLFAPADASTGTDAPMLWQAVAGLRFRTPDGYFVGRAFTDSHPGDLPPFERLMRQAQERPHTPNVTGQVRQAIEREFVRDRVTLVLVGPMPRERRAIRIVTRLLGRPGEWVDGVWLWRRPSTGWSVASPPGA